MPTTHPLAWLQEPEAAQGRGLAAYLSLPLDQYSLLDPTWVTRDAGGADRFLLRVPLYDVVGLDLQPQINVRVALDARNNQVLRAAGWLQSAL